MTLGESFSSLGFSFHCKISILEFSGTQICWCFSHPESILKGNNPIKAYFTYHKIYPFQVYNSMIFSKFTHLCNHHHKSVLEHFYHSNKILCVCACSVVSDSLWPTRLLCPWNFQARVLEWVAISSCRVSSPPRDRIQSPAAPALVGGFFTTGLPAQVNPHSHPLPQATSNICTFYLCRFIFYEHSI